MAGSRARASARKKPGSRALVRGRSLSILEAQGSCTPDGYALLDSGNGRKLERFGQVIVDRPEPQALWRPVLSKTEWGGAHAVFSPSQDDDEKGRWRVDKPVPESWPVKIGGVTVLCKLQGLWHLGLFPEQLPHWQWMREQIGTVSGRRARVLNLFAYTGAASLIAASHGCEVTHVDASKKAVQWAKENQAASQLDGATVRWIIDDAVKFVAREVRRDKRYDIILVDPPKFGRGPAGETWDLFSSLPRLLDDCARLLDPSNASLVLTVYAIRASAVAFEQLCRQSLSGMGGTFSAGELVIAPQDNGNVVPTSLYVRWRSTRHGT